MSQHETLTDEAVRGAIRTLRSRLGLNQVEYSLRLGVSYGAIQKYEQKRSPRGESLRPFIEVAQAEGHDDLVALFERAVIQGFVEDAVSEVMLLVAAKELVRSRPEVLIAAAERVYPDSKDRPVSVLIASAFLLPDSDARTLAEQATQMLHFRAGEHRLKDIPLGERTRTAIFNGQQEGGSAESETPRTRGRNRIPKKK